MVSVVNRVVAAVHLEDTLDLHARLWVLGSWQRQLATTALTWIVVLGAQAGVEVVAFVANQALQVIMVATRAV